MINALTSKMLDAANMPIFIKLKKWWMYVIFIIPIIYTVRLEAYWPSVLWFLFALWTVHPACKPYRQQRGGSLRILGLHVPTESSPDVKRQTKLP